jgi:hypothetical protein
MRWFLVSDGVRVVVVLPIFPTVVASNGRGGVA